MHSDINITYFWNYLKLLDTFRHKESMSLTTGEYMRLVMEIETIRHYIKYLEFNELINIETTYKTVTL